MNSPEYRCPRCYSTVDLRVVISVVAKLHQEDGNVETEIIGDQEWDDNSRMLCNKCEFASDAQEFIDVVVPTGPARIQYDPMVPDDPDFWIWRIGETCFVEAVTRTPFKHHESADDPLPWPAWLFASESWASEMENKRRNPGWTPGNRRDQEGS